MEHKTNRIELIKYLLAENLQTTKIPDDEYSQKKLLRGLFNIRIPKSASKKFLRLQDEYLKKELLKKGITDISDIPPVIPDIYLWQGDITTLRCDGIVNAANSQMLGCFHPNHSCVDNAVHTFAGIQLRQECADIMKEQGCEEPTGQAKITGAYNLPCKYILHTVGPIVCGEPTDKQEEKLACCYRSCLALACERGLKSLAFCCISTGEYNFPNERAAQIAIQTVTEYKRKTQNKIKVVFNVFKECDYEIYAGLLGANK